MVIVQCAVIFAFLALGELVVWLTGIPVPSSIVGMLLLTAALQVKAVKLRHVSGVADFLVRNLGFFFVPAGVALIGYFPVLRDQWMPITVASVISTIVVLWTTGQIHQLSRKFFTRHTDARK